MAIHSGAVDPEISGDYRSPVLNRLGRLLGAGFGGQVILSQTTAELCRDSLPPGVSLIDLGEHRLKDLSRPERIYQLGDPGLPAEFPALKTMDRRPNNLPIQPTPFVGRTQEVESLCAMLQRDPVRLVTVTGPGGIGKTRIGLQSAAELLDEYPAGVFCVELAPIVSTDLLPNAIAATLNLHDVPGEPVMTTLKHRLHDDRLLLLLDNFEHLAPAAPLVGELLASCPQIKVLVTSRLRLRIRGEHAFPLAPLDVPNPESPVSFEELTDHDSVRLFVERAKEINPAFVATPENAPVIASICARLDGLPLAIELAASRTRMLPPAALLHRLTSRLPLLTGGPRDAPERQQTLRGAILWSYDLLSEQERHLFRHLSIFRGGAALEAIASITGMDIFDMFDPLEGLVDHSLIRQSETGGEPRYHMLETIREFGNEQLRACGEYEDLARQHATHWAALADRFVDLFGTPTYEQWLKQVAGEQDNMRASLRWSLDHDPKVAYRLLMAMDSFWQIHGNLNEAISWLEQSDGVITDSHDRARVLGHLALLTQMTGDYGKAERSALEALAIFRESGSRQGIVSMLQIAGFAASQRGETSQSQQMLAESVETAREIDNAYELCEALNYFGFILYLQGEYDRARPLLEEAVERGRDALMDEGFLNILHSLGEVCRAQGDITGAARTYREGLTSRTSNLFHFGTVQLLGGVAILAAEQGFAAEAIRIFAAEETLRSGMQLGLSDEVLEDYATARNQARARLDPVLIDQAIEEGSRFTMEHVVAFATSVVDAILAADS
jgi:predicted ATPase